MVGSIFFSLFTNEFIDSFYLKKELSKGRKGGGGILLSILYVLLYSFYKYHKIALDKKENRSLKSFIQNDSRRIKLFYIIADRIPY